MLQLQLPMLKADSTHYTPGLFVIEITKPGINCQTVGQYSSIVVTKFCETLGFCRYRPGVPQVYNFELGSSRLVSYIDAQELLESLECFIGFHSMRKVEIHWYCIEANCASTNKQSERIEFTLL